MDHRIPDDLLIPTLVTLMDQEEKEKEKENEGPGCCGCLVAIALFSIGSFIFTLIF